MAVVFPTPVNGIKNPNIEMEGIVYRKLMTLSVNLLVFLYSLINIPMNNPIIIAINIDTAEIFMCSKSKSKKNSFFSKNNSIINYILSIACTGHVSKHKPQCKQCSC